MHKAVAAVSQAGAASRPVAFGQAAASQAVAVNRAAVATQAGGTQAAVVSVEEAAAVAIQVVAAEVAITGDPVAGADIAPDVNVNKHGPHHHDAARFLYVVNRQTA